MRVICDCGDEMVLDEYEPDQDRYVASFSCEDCGAEAAVVFVEGDG